MIRIASPDITDEDLAAVYRVDLQPEGKLNVDRMSVNQARAKYKLVERSLGKGL